MTTAASAIAGGSGVGPEPRAVDVRIDPPSSAGFWEAWINDYELQVCVAERGFDATLAALEREVLSVLDLWAGHRDRSQAIPPVIARLQQARADERLAQLLAACARLEWDETQIPLPNREES